MMTSNTFSGSAGWRMGPRRRKPRMPWLLFVVVVALLVGGVYVFRAPLSSLLWQAAVPVMAVRNALTTTDATALRAEVATLTAKLVDRDALYQENLNLKQLLNRAAGRSVTLAAIVQRPPGTPYDTFIIDAGADQNIVVGSLVSLGGSALVGVVTEVMQNTSRVTLYSAAGQTHEGTLVVGETPLTISIEGQGGGSMRAQVPAGTGATPGDDVFIPGIGMGLSAEVRHVEARDGESFETVYFSLPGNLNARYVEIWQ